MINFPPQCRPKAAHLVRTSPVDLDDARVILPTNTLKTLTTGITPASVSLRVAAH